MSKSVQDLLSRNGIAFSDGTAVHSKYGELDGVSYNMLNPHILRCYATDGSEYLTDVTGQYKDAQISASRSVANRSRAEDIVEAGNMSGYLPVWLKGLETQLTKCQRTAYITSVGVACAQSDLSEMEKNSNIERVKTDIDNTASSVRAAGPQVVRTKNEGVDNPVGDCLGFVSRDYEGSTLYVLEGSAIDVQEDTIDSLISSFQRLAGDLIEGSDKEDAGGDDAVDGPSFIGWQGAKPEVQVWA